MVERKPRVTWAEGHIAEFTGEPYLIEQIRDHDYEDYVVIDFRALRTWELCPNDRRKADGEGEGCNCVREPTDKELAFIAACRLMDDQPDVALLRGFTKC